MTREEAIDVLKHNYPSSCYEDLCKAVYMAIEVLEQPEIIHCRNCKHNESSSEAGNANCNKFYGMTDQMGFCHYGERRTDDLE